MGELLPLFATFHLPQLEIVFCFILRAILFLCRASLCASGIGDGTVSAKSLAAPGNIEFSAGIIYTFRGEFPASKIVKFRGKLFNCRHLIVIFIDFVAEKFVKLNSIFISSPF